MSGQERRVTFLLDILYSDALPRKVKVKNCRGLSISRVEILEKNVKSVADDDPIFELIENVKDLIFEMNLKPDGECSICLYPYQNNSQLYKADCFHLFHSDCFTKYFFETSSRIKSENKKLPDDHKISENIHCPVCREVLNVSAADFRKFRNKSTNSGTEMEPDVFLKNKFAKLAIERQKSFSQNFSLQKENDSHFRLFFSYD